MNNAVRTALAVVILGLPAVAAAQQYTKNQGYLVDQNYNVVMATGAGVCIRTSDWTPALAARAEACSQCTPDLCAKPAPAPKAAPKPAPRPEPKKEPPKLVPQKINFSADALFDFDQAVLKPEARAILDDLVRVLQGAQYEVILAIGHTDRIGPATYNLKLSQRRAAAVKDYLVGKGIAPNRVYADGKGETQPVTRPGDCKGKTGKSLISCYQPDRRVDVEVTGTK